ncbi:hypothetical protein K438DRAFT_1777023 [Mycena galopus ATCC 62051]|nr:hypothetical protein K438DRAFT_1777023 [Mycena galopus ATCC 62051]
MELQEKAKLLEIPANLLEKLFPSTCGSVQELSAHNIPYQRPSAHETSAMAYLRADIPSSSDIDPTTLPMPPTSVIGEIVQTLRRQFTARTSQASKTPTPSGSFHTGPSFGLSGRPASAGILRSVLWKLGFSETHRTCLAPQFWIESWLCPGISISEGSTNHKLGELGENIANGRAEQLATVANVGGDHWIALIVNFASKAVYYFDSLKQPIDSELREAYDWWILQHHGTEFGWVTLPCLRQLDGHNCGLFAANRVAYYIDQDAYPLLDPQGCNDERLNTLAKFLDQHNGTTLTQAADIGFSFTFRFDLIGNDVESDGEDDQEPHMPVSTPPPSLMILPLSPMKGALGDRAIGSPPASPVKKRPSAGKEKVTAASARGLKAMGGVLPSKHTSLFKFFSKETEQERRVREAKQKEAAELRAEERAEEELQTTRNQIVAADEKREAAKKRKCKERERKCLAEVDAGTQNEDFTLKMKKKRKILAHSLKIVQIELRDEPNANNIVEMTRPARQIEQRYKEKHRTHKRVARKSTN